ncbi:MAG: lipopolysaccharide biosynthesis protein, partial [Clostridiales bacterium]
MVYSLGTILLRVSSFLLIPIYTHYLSISDYGLLSTLLMTIQLMVTIVDFGIRSAMMRFVSKFDSEHRLKELLGSLLSLNILGGVIVLIITVILLRPVFGNILHINNVFSYSMLTCFAAINQSLCINLISYYRARNKGFLFMIINLSALFLLIAGSIVFLI